MISYLLAYNRFANLLGIFFILGIAYLFSHKRKHINLRLIIHALGAQIIIAIVMLKTSIGKTVVGSIAHGVYQLYQFADQGSAFMFGGLVNRAGPWGFIFGVKVLPIIIFFGALMSLLFHLGVVQRVVVAISYVIQPFLGTSGAETLCAIANSFLGQTEAPLLVRCYLASMTKSELFLVMVSGMGTISGAILAVFASMGVPAEHLLTASLMGIFSSIVIAKTLYPETEKSQTAAGANVIFTPETKNALDAISAGTIDGLQLALNVGAMLISFLSLIALINAVLVGSSGWLNVGFATVGVSIRLPDISLHWLFSYLFAPFGYFLGFTGKQALQAAQLIGTKVTMNELIAYDEMVKMGLPDRMESILTYALCGFSNFSCIGIQVGGIGALVPNKRAWLCQLGLYAVLGGTLANLLSAMIVALIL